MQSDFGIYNWIAVEAVWTDSATYCSLRPYNNVSDEADRNWSASSDTEERLLLLFNIDLFAIDDVNTA